MSVLTCEKFSENKMGFANYIYHNKTDFNNKSQTLIKFPDSTIYESKHDDRIKLKTVQMSSRHRSKHSIEENKQYTFIEVVDRPTNILKTVEINVTVWNAIDSKIKRKIVDIHEDDIIEDFREKFCGRVLCSENSFITQIDERYYCIDLTGKFYGIMGNKTEIIVKSTDTYLNLITGKVLKRDLFRDNYNFEELGIGGLDQELIKLFRRALSTRALNPAIISKLGINHVKGILLYGPPGTGKTLIARKIGHMISPIPPKIINGPEILNKFVGQAEENMRNIFKPAMEDPNNLYVIIFDEADALFKTRGRNEGVGGQVGDNITNTLLTAIDGTKAIANIFVILMTNRKDLLDPAVLRPGRIEVHININLPDKRGREQIFRIHTDKMKKNNMMEKTVDISELAELTENFSGSEIEAVVKNASSMAIHCILSDEKNTIIDDSDIIVTKNYFLQAVKEIIPMFGNMSTKIENLVPKDFNFKNNNQKEMINSMSEILYNKNRINTILIHGTNMSGKTTLMAYFAIKCKIPYTKFIRSFDMLGMNESGKTHLITETIINAHLSKHSLIIIDDIEDAINYSRIGSVINYSNNLYLTLMTLLRTPPNNENNSMTIVITCTNKDIQNIFQKVVTYNYEL